MASIETLTEFFGWMTVINFGMLLLATVMLLSQRKMAARIHGKMFGLDEVDLSRAYFRWVAQYKIGVFLFNLVPWIAFKMMN